MSDAVPAAMPRRVSWWAQARRFTKWTALGLLLVLCATIAIVVARLDTLVHDRLARGASALGARMGRAVTVGATHVTLGATLDVTVDEIVISAAEGQSGAASEPLVRVHAVRVGVAGWPLLRSLGETLEIRWIEATRPELVIVRMPGERFSYEDVLERLAGPGPEAHRRETVTIDRALVRGAAIRLFDLAEPPESRAPPVTLEAIDVEAKGIGRDGPISITLDAALLSSQKNLHAAVELDSTAAGASPAARIRRAEVHLAPVAIDPILAFVPRRGELAVTHAIVDVDATLAVPEGTDGFELTGTAGAGELTVRASAGGAEPRERRPIDVRARANLRVDAGRSSLEVRSFELTVGSMSVVGQADVAGTLSTPEVRALSLSSRGLTLEGLVDLAPPGVLPAGVALAGPLELRAEGRGSPREAEIEATLDLRDAAVTLPGLVKPPGTALAAELRARLVDGGIDVRALGVTLGPLVLNLQGRVRGAADFDLAFDSGKVPIDALVRLSPAIARAASKQGQHAGTLQVTGKVGRAGATTKARASVALADADVKTRALTLSGAAIVEVTSELTGDGPLSVSADVDLGRARLLVPGRLDKRRGTPMRIAAAVERQGPVTMVRSARLAIPGTTLAGSLRMDASRPHVTAKLDEADIDLATLASVMPGIAAAGLPSAIRAARIRGKLTLEGNPERLADAHVRIHSLDVAAPFGRVRGTVELSGLDPPKRIGFDLEGEAINLDAAGAAFQKPDGSRTATASAPAIDGKLRLASARVGGATLRDFAAELTYANRKLHLTTLRFAAFGGSADAGGTTVDLTGPVPAFALQLKVVKLDLAALAALRGGSTRSVKRGQLGAEITLQGKGDSAAAIKPSLAGQMKLQAQGIAVHTRRSVHATIVNPLLGKLAAGAAKNHPEREVDLDISRASTEVRIEGGKIIFLHPLRVQTAEGSLELDGIIWLDGRLSLSGAFTLLPAAIEKASSGRLLPASPVPVRMRIRGRSDAPQIELLDLAETVKALRGSMRHAMRKRLESKP